MTDSVNETTARAATQKNKLPLGELRLLGIVARPDKAQALLRAPSGETFWAEAGSRTDYGNVIAIDARSVILDTGTSARRLELLS